MREGDGDAAGACAELEDAGGGAACGELTPEVDVVLEGAEVEVVEGRDGLEGAFELLWGEGEWVVGHAGLRCLFSVPAPFNGGRVDRRSFASVALRDAGVGRHASGGVRSDPVGAGFSAAGCSVSRHYAAAVCAGGV